MLSSIKELDVNSIESSTLIEYLRIKGENPDCVILFQIGKFFLTFFEEAKLFSQLTGFILNARTFKGTGDIMQCGFNASSNPNVYIKLLLKEGYRVCLCPEYKNENGKSFRRLTRIYTAGTTFEADFLDCDENNYILAACKSGKEINIAYADVSTGQFYRTKGEYAEAKIEIEKIEPSEVLILKSQKEHFENIINKYNTILLDDNFSPDCPKFNIEQYCKLTQKDFCSKLDEIIDYEIDNYLSMDEITRKTLELTKNKRFLKKKGSLLWFLDYTKTSMGARLLKKNINEPLLNIKKIQQRQEAVRELLNNPKIIESCIEVMKKFCDLQRTCSRISNQTILPKDLLSLAQNSVFLEELSLICANVDSYLLKLNKSKVDKILDFAYEIQTAIKNDASSELKNGNIIKDGYNGELDFIRSQLYKYDKELDKYEQELRKKYGIKNLKITKSIGIGFCVEVTPSNAHKLIDKFYKIQEIYNCIRFTNDKLREIQKEYSDLILKANKLEYKLYCEIRLFCTQFVGIIRTLAQEIANIDVYVSYAKAALDNGLVCPSFNEDGIYIQNGFHPSLLKLQNAVIKNGTNMDNGNVFVITGANMSGKSTYLKHNAIIVLLSQIGAYVPADKADISIVDKIFFRQGSTDDIVNSNSSFMIEMNDLKFILENITNNSLVLLDEPAKSTNAKEGGAIARAVCEYLIENTNAKIMVATHNLELAKMEKMFPQRVYNYVIGESDASKTIVFDRKLRRGVVDSSFAINTAILAKFPDKIIQLAKKYAAN